MAISTLEMPLNSSDDLDSDIEGKEGDSSDHASHNSISLTVRGKVFFLLLDKELSNH